MKYLDSVQDCLIEDKIFLLAEGPNGQYEIFWERKESEVWKMKKKGDTINLSFTLSALKEAIEVLDINQVKLKAQAEDIFSVQGYFCYQLLVNLGEYFGKNEAPLKLTEQKDFFENLKVFVKDFVDLQEPSEEKKETKRSPLKLLKPE